MQERKIRVLHLISSLGVGGAEKLVLLLALHINSERFQMLPCAWYRSGPIATELQAAKIPFRVLGLARRSVLTGPLFFVDLWRIVSALIPILRDSSIDIVHAHDTPSTMLGLLATWRLGNVRLCTTVHSVVLHRQRSRVSPRTWLMRAMIRATFPRVDRIVAVSKEVARTVQRSTGIVAERITTIPNGIDPTRFQKPEDRSETRQRLALPTHRLIIVSVGRLIKPKGYPHLLGALALIPQDLRPLTLIVGDGPDRRMLEAKTKTLQLDHDVRFLGNRDDVPTLLAAADIFVLASLWEGIPLALLESMASGLPAIVTEVGGNPEVIEHGKSGVLVPAADEAAMATALCGLLQAREQRERIGQEARQRFDHYFNIRRFVEAHEDLYEEMLCQRLGISRK